MTSTSFIELSYSEECIVDGGSWIGNLLVVAGGACLAFATGPVAVATGFGVLLLNSCDSFGW